MRFIWGPREKRSEQLAYSFWRTLGWTIGCQFGERDEHKVALFDPRVRNLQAGFADPFVSIYKNIQV